MARCFMLLSLLLAFARPLAASALPNTDPAFVKQLVEATTQLQRNKLLKPQDYVYDFNAAMTGESKGPDGETIAVNAGNMPALLHESVAMTLGFIGPCGMNTPHTHPRAAEFNYVVNGSFLSGFVQENGARTILSNVTAGQASLFPKGAVHFEANLECTSAFFVASFGSSDPGTLQIAQAFSGLPPSITAATLGQELSEAQLATLNSMIPANVAFGLHDCVKRCGLSTGLGPLASLFTGSSENPTTYQAGSSSSSPSLAPPWPWASGSKAQDHSINKVENGEKGLSTLDTDASSSKPNDSDSDHSWFSPKSFGAGVGAGALAALTVGSLIAFALPALLRRRRRRPQAAPKPAHREGGGVTARKRHSRLAGEMADTHEKDELVRAPMTPDQTSYVDGQVYNPFEPTAEAETGRGAPDPAQGSTVSLLRQRDD